MQAVVVGLAGSTEARCGAWRGFAVMLAFLGTLAVAGCSASEQPAGSVPSAEPSYPVKHGPAGRYLVDQRGAPFLILGESPQAMIGDLSEADADLFLSNRKSHGFNTVWINLLCASGTGCNADGTTFDGIAPFTTGTNLSTYDVSTPNEAYFARADRMLQLAAKYGILVILDPAETISWLTCLAEQWPGQGPCLWPLPRHAVQGLPQYCLDERQRLPDLEHLPSDDALVQEVALGIKETDPNHIHTVELNEPVSSSLDDSSWAPIISLNAAYTYFPAYAEVLHAYNQSASMPVFMVETIYEFETLHHVTNLAGLRRQAYWTSLSGATGQLYGNRLH